MGGGGTDLLSASWGVAAITGERFQVPEYETSRVSYPRTSRQKEFDYSLYEFTSPAPETAGAVQDIDVGTQDDLHVLRFHAKETSGGRSFRWSRDTSYISLALLPAASRQVTVWMDAGGRPPAAPPAQVTLSLQFGFGADQAPRVDRTLGAVHVGDGVRPYTFEIPGDLAAAAAEGRTPVRLKLAGSVWVPRVLLGSADDREVGVMVDRLTVR
jgi:hypothetical protein